MSRQDDWLAYVEDQGAFDRYHFGPLITDTDDPVDLEAAFGPLPNGAELIRRIRAIQQENDFTGLYYIPKPENKLSRPVMRELAEKYTESMARRLSSMGMQDLARMILANPITYMGRSEYERLKSQQALLLSDISMEIGDDFDRYTAQYPGYVWGLEEAVLFMTKVPEVTRFVMNGMVEYPLEEELAYALWKGGARVSFCDDQTIIVIEDE